MLKTSKILFFLLLFPGVSKAQSVYEVYNRIAEAYGGKEAWSEVQSLTAKGEWAVSPDSNFSFMYKMLDPDLQRLDFTFQENMHTIVNYGTKGWIHDPTGLFLKYERMDAMEQLSFRNAFLFQNNLLNYRQKGLGLELDGTVEIGENRYWLVRIMGYKNKEELYFVDQETALVQIKQTYYYLRKRSGVVNYHIGGYRTFEGKQVPTEVQVVTGDHQIRLKFSSYVFGTELEKSDFTDNQQIDYTTNILSFTKKEAQEYLHNEIPMTRQMGIEVQSLNNEEVRLGAPLALNANHFNSAFGGSVDSLFLTAGWAYLRLITHHYEPDPTIIGNRSETTFYRPITRDFAAKLVMPEKKTVKKFLKDYDKKGKAKIVLQAVIEEQGKKYASFEGTYVLLKGPVRR